MRRICRRGGPVPDVATGPNQRGFTLLEVLIAATLIAIMMVLLFGSLRLGAGSWDSGEQRFDQTSQMLVVQSFLRKHLSAALPWPLGDAVRPGAQFIGNRRSFDYVGFLPSQIRTGLYRFRVFVDRRGDRKSLRVSVRSLGVPPRDEKIEDLEILPEVDDVRFAYLARATPEVKPVWVEEWVEDMIPALVSIRVELPGQDPWPALLIAPRIDPPS